MKTIALSAIVEPRGTSCRLVQTPANDPNLQLATHRGSDAVNAASAAPQRTGDAPGSRRRLPTSGACAIGR
jgi:hypothetical protein